LYYDIVYNPVDNSLLRDLDLLSIDNLVGDKTSNPLVFLHIHLYDNLHKLSERDFLLMETVLCYDQSSLHSNLLYYDIVYNPVDNSLLRDLDLLSIDNLLVTRPAIRWCSCVSICMTTCTSCLNVTSC